MRNRVIILMAGKEKQAFRISNKKLRQDTFSGASHTHIHVRDIALVDRSYGILRLWRCVRTMIMQFPGGICTVQSTSKVVNTCTSDLLQPSLQEELTTLQ